MKKKEIKKLTTDQAIKNIDKMKKDLFNFRFQKSNGQLTSPSKIKESKKIPNFFPGDILKVGVRITEGKRERVQYFEGVCIAKKNRDINSSFTVRKISFGEGVERTFALYSPIIGSIKVIRSGQVRRAKLYYLRERTGKSARIAEKIKKKIGIEIEQKDVKNSDETASIKNLSKEKIDNKDLEKKTTEEKNIKTEKEKK